MHIDTYMYIIYLFVLAAIAALLTSTLPLPLIAGHALDDEQDDDGSDGSPLATPKQR